MLISINQVSLQKHDKGYMLAEVSYTKDGKPEKKKIMSFAAPSVYAALSNFKTFPVDVNVTMVKEGAYWNWKEIEVSNGAQTSGTTTKPATRVTGSNYETPEERARRQVYIIRQSSVASAIEYAKARSPKGAEEGIQSVIETAKVIEAYVLSNTQPTADDIPL